MTDEIVGQVANVALTVVCVAVIPWAIRVSRDLGFIKLNMRNHARAYAADKRKFRKRQRWMHQRIRKVEARIPPGQGGP
jgi:ABC-type cobalamin transport system permease subunit